MNTDQVYIDSDLLVELVTKEYNPLPYVLPVNQYIIESFDFFLYLLSNHLYYY